MPRDTTYRDGYGFLLAHQNDEPLPASDAGVEQVTLQHRVVLRHDRDYDGALLRALDLMNVRRIGRYQGIKVAEAIGDRSPLELGDQFSVMRVNISLWPGCRPGPGVAAGQHLGHANRFRQLPGRDCIPMWEGAGNA
jgi:hypothetical protein